MTNRSCTCEIRTKLVGDGCEVCNPAKALEYAKERIAELESSLTAEAEHAAQLRKALIAARSHIDNLHGEIGRRTYQQEELEVTTAFDGLGDGQFNGDWASIMGIIDAAMEKANG